MRRVAAVICWKEGSTSTAVARVVRASGVYFGFATNASCPGQASSRPAAEVTSASGSPCKVAPRRAARSASFMGEIVRLVGAGIGIERKMEEFVLETLLGWPGRKRLAAGWGCDHRKKLEFSHGRPRDVDALGI